MYNIIDKDKSLKLGTEASLNPLWVKGGEKKPRASSVCCLF